MSHETREKLDSGDMLILSLRESMDYDKLQANRAVDCIHDCIQQILVFHRLTEMLLKSIQGNHDSVTSGIHAEIECARFVVTFPFHENSRVVCGALDGLD